MSKQKDVHSISVQYYYSDLTAQVRTMSGKSVRFHFTPELRKLFETEMNKALK